MGIEMTTILPTERMVPERRTCTACGVEKGLGRFPARGRGKSTVCRACLGEGKAPEPRPARRMTEKDPEQAGEPQVAEPVVPPVPTIVRGQVLEFAKALRQTAHDLRQATSRIIATSTDLTPELDLSGYGDWVNTVAAKNLDRAAAQLELLCK